MSGPLLHATLYQINFSCTLGLDYSPKVLLSRFVFRDKGNTLC